MERGLASNAPSDLLSVVETAEGDVGDHEEGEEEGHGDGSVAVFEFHGEREVVVLSFSFGGGIGDVGGVKEVVGVIDSLEVKMAK